MGYDFSSDKYVMMTEEGIIDPTKVTRIALQNAVSAVCALIMTKSAIVEE